jgi:hypothetical protein
MTAQFVKRVDEAHAAGTAPLVFRDTNRVRDRNVALSLNSSRHETS